MATMDVAAETNDIRELRRQADIMDDIRNDFEYWREQMELRDESDMLRAVDRVTNLIAVETTLETTLEMEVLFDWSGMYDDESRETILVKSKPRKGRPSKRELHPVRPRCMFLRYHRNEVKCQAERLQARQRIADLKDLREQVEDCGDDLVAGSVNQALRRDIPLDLNSPDRRFTITILPNGKMLYSFTKEECVASGRKCSVGMATSRHAYQAHPGTPTWARRPAR